MKREPFPAGNPPGASGNRTILLVFGSLLTGGAICVLLCCGGMRFFFGMMADNVAQKLEAEPEFSRRVGQVQEINYDFFGSIGRADETEVYEVKGTKWSGRLTVKQEKQFDQDAKILWARFTLPSGEIVEIVPGRKAQAADEPSRENAPARTTADESATYMFTLHWDASATFVEFTAVPPDPYVRLSTSRKTIDGEQFNGLVFRARTARDPSAPEESECEINCRWADERTILIKLTTAVPVRIRSDDDSHSRLAAQGGEEIAWGAVIKPGQHDLQASRAPK